MVDHREIIENISISDFDYFLPDERIAKYPIEERDKSKLLVYRGGQINHLQFNCLPELLTDELLVFNNTRVIPARIKFRKPTGAEIEVFCLEPHEPSDYQIAFQSRRCKWKCIVGNLKKWKTGELTHEINNNGQIIKLYAKKNSDFRSHQVIEFSWDKPLTFGEIIELAGVTPIPPYLNRESETLDYYRYQTVYSKIKGSVAAPTAGLHFTDQIIHKLKSNGVITSEVTLHVGAGTFKPVQQEMVIAHEMHTEFFSVSTDTLKYLAEKHGNIIAVGTTTLRTLESLYWLGVKLNNGLINSDQLLLHIDQWEAYELKTNLSFTESMQQLVDFAYKNGKKELWATTRIMIVPGYNVRSIKALITNFHQPKSTLLLLVASIAGNNWKKIYDYAMNNDFRFLSYGDSSILFLG